MHLPMYAVIFWSVLTVSGVVVVAVLLLLGRKRVLSAWDLLLVMLPFPFWVGLAALGPRAKSLSNIIELFALAPVLALLLLLRLRNPAIRGSTAFLGAILITALVYALVPGLPE